MQASLDCRPTPPNRPRAPSALAREANPSQGCVVTNKTRVLFVVNADWFFLSHRLPLAIAARNAGAEVIVVAGDTGKSGAIRDQGFEFVNLPISRGGTNPLSNARTLGFLVRLYRQLRP